MIWASLVVVIWLAACLLPSAITGDWHRDRCEKIMNREDGWV